MKKMIFVLMIAAAVFLGANFAKAAPGPWGIALNVETKECAGFWGGDEFTAYDLPEGWKSYFPEYNPKTKKTTLVTEVGECDFKMQEEGKCCQQLGYKYVSDNIGKNQKTVLSNREEFQNELTQSRKKTPYVMVAILLLVIAAIILLAKWALGRKKKDEKTNE